MIGFFKRSRVFVWGYLCDRGAVTAIEYGLIAAGLALGIALATFAMGDSLGEMFSATGDVLMEGAERATSTES